MVLLNMVVVKVGDFVVMVEGFVLVVEVGVLVVDVDLMELWDMVVFLMLVLGKVFL